MVNEALRENLIAEREDIEREWQEVVRNCENGVIDRKKINEIMKKYNDVDQRIIEFDTLLIDLKNKT